MVFLFQANDVEHKMTIYSSRNLGRIIAPASASQPNEHENPKLQLDVIRCVEVAKTITVSILHVLA